MGKYPTWKDVEKARKVSIIRKVKSFFKKFKKYFLWSVLPSLLLFSFLQFALKNFVILDNANYILSSISQGLASLIALLFVIVFFLCQSTGRVSILKQILKPDGYFLLFVFILSIIFPLIILRYGIKELLVNISISMAFLCLALLFPFIISVNKIMINFGIQNIIAEIGSLRFPLDSKKYRLLIDDLNAIGIREVIKLKLHGDLVVSELIEELERAIENLEGFADKCLSFAMLANIGIYSLTEEGGSKGHFNHVKQIVNYTLLNNCTKINKKGRELFRISLTEISQILSKLKLNEKLDKNIRLDFSEILIESSFKIFKKIENLKNIKNKRAEKELNVLKNNQKQLEEVILSYLRREIIFNKDFELVYNKKFTSDRSKKDEEFKNYLHNLLISK